MNMFQAVVVPSLVVIALLVLVRTARHTVPWRTGILWMAAWSIAATLVAFPASTAVIAKWLGIGRGADLVLYAATLSGLGASLYFYGRYRHLEELVTGMIRREALRAACRQPARRPSTFDRLEGHLDGERD
jgi:hypothetical protein